MQGDEPGDRGMVRDRQAFEKEHEVDVPPAGCFYVTTGEDAVHCSIDHDLEHLARARLIFPDPVVGTIELRKIHSLHECTQKADWIVRWDHGVHFEWKFDLIAGVIKCIISL